MIKLKDANDNVLDLNAFPNFGIEWNHAENIANFENPLEKIPGGSFLALKSKPKVQQESYTLITASMNLEAVRNVMTTISSFCVDEFGLPKQIKMFKEYEGGYRLVKLAGIGPTYATNFHKIVVTFNCLDNYMYKEPITTSKTNITLSPSVLESNSITKDSPLGADVYILLNGLDATNLIIGSRTSLGDDYRIEVGKIKGSLSFDSTNFELNLNGATQIQRIPNKFKFYKSLYFIGDGAIGHASVTYTEVEL